MAAAPQARRGIVALFKRGWHEIPEVIGSTAMAIVGTGLGCYGLYNYHRKDKTNKRFKMTYTVYRSDDPRAANIRD